MPQLPNGAFSNFYSCMAKATGTLWKDAILFAVKISLSPVRPLDIYVQECSESLWDAVISLKA